MSTPVPPAGTMLAEVLVTPHTPPTVGSLKLIEEPAHTEFAPAMTPGNGFTVTVAVLMQPVGKV